MLKALGIFVLMIVLDLAWARYTIALQVKLHWQASWMAGVIYLLSGMVTIAYVDSPWMLVPAVLGAIVGTYLGSRFTHR